VIGILKGSCSLRTGGDCSVSESYASLRSGVCGPVVPEERLLERTIQRSISISLHGLCGSILTGQGTLGPHQDVFLSCDPKALKIRRRTCRM
jgi:hypothetical protein